MGKTLLFLVDRQGQPLPTALRTAVEAAHRWVDHDYPNLEPSLLATWAEQVATSMAESELPAASPRRYAYAALRSKVREHFRSSTSREVSVGAFEDLEKQAGFEMQTVRHIERQVLFRELSDQLSERDQEIFILLQQGVTSPQNIGPALGISYNAAAKAVQRVRERLHAILARRPAPMSGKEHDDND